ncbi:hypothetical protein RFEPED_0382 [Rickettsia felis str. Pedreira]|uniref:Uncharacterized protein n=2 Tax=Rickettsia felis TaxID=42862 RepID=A0A0F3MQQ7_RICFI|nr:hypothetical protein [Rickettsia felis]AAY61323.1 unknown [Rickettsia felis URRWXCal2]KHO02824.1 hypothetical protein JS55_02760 [Rickettsia felis str. LSU]KHO03769.1 hypothetical protein JS61_02685 [Rickettsia felis]KJV58011.1 hypothetical protein RFEPED_0382 [Rickettsia felis str. Pedreira]MDE8611657.1 hypothetical protein [Rickettsia felis]
MTKDISDTLNNLYDLIARLIILLEDELVRITLHKNENNIIDTKNVTETLNKLVNLIVQLNKLSNSRISSENSKIDEKDKMIIDNFLENYNLKNLF